MSAGAEIEIERIEQALIARPQNKLIDDMELKALGSKIDEAAGENSGVTVVIVDLVKVSILPSLGLGLLVQVNNKCNARRQKLKLARVQPQVRQVFAVTRLDRIFQFADSIEAAMK